MKYGVKSDHKICFGASLSHTNRFVSCGTILRGYNHQPADRPPHPVWLRSKIKFNFYPFPYLAKKKAGYWYHLFFGGKVLSDLTWNELATVQLSTISFSSSKMHFFKKILLHVWCLIPTNINLWKNSKDTFQALKYTNVLILLEHF